jgi:hypothetical protein
MNHNDAEEIAGATIVAGGNLYGGDTDGDLRCFKASDGGRVWGTLDVMPNSGRRQPLFQIGYSKLHR